MKRVLYFSAPWCGQCRAQQRILDAMIAPEVVLQKIDAETAPGAAEAWGVKSLPTIVVLDEDGIEDARFTGVVTATKLKEVING